MNKSIAADQEADRKRQAHQDHRKAINNNILDKLTSLGCAKNVAIEIVKAMATGQVPHVEVKY